MEWVLSELKHTSHRSSEQPNNTKWQGKIKRQHFQKKNPISYRLNSKKRVNSLVKQIQAANFLQKMEESPSQTTLLLFADVGYMHGVIWIRSAQQGDVCFQLRASGCLALIAIERHKIWKRFRVWRSNRTRKDVLRCRRETGMQLMSKEYSLWLVRPGRRKIPLVSSAPVTFCRHLPLRPAIYKTSSSQPTFATSVEQQNVETKPILNFSLTSYTER